MRKTKWLVVLGLCVSTHCWADFLSGNDLLSRLRDYKSPRSNDIVSASAGYGYLLGISDAMNRTEHPRTRFKFCIPAEVTGGQLMDVTISFLESNPQKRHFAAHSLVENALEEAFPCSRL